MTKSEKLISEVISEVSDLQRQVLVKALTAVFEEMEEMNAELKHYRAFWKEARSMVGDSDITDSEAICILRGRIDYWRRHG